MSEIELEQAANDMNIVVLELVEIDVFAAIERHFKVINGVTEARDPIESFGLNSAFSPLDLLDALLD